jgi:hypothetical protein
MGNSVPFERVTGYQPDFAGDLRPVCVLSFKKNDLMATRSPFITFDVIFSPENRTTAGVIPVEAVKSAAPIIATEAIPADDHSGWSWEQVEKGISHPAPKAGTRSENSKTREETSVYETQPSDWSEPGLMESLKPLMNSARSLYTIYEHWAGLPRLQVTVSLA